MLLSPLLVIWSMVLVLWLYLKRRHFLKLGSQIPGPYAYPIIGNAPMFLKKPEVVINTIYKLSRQYKRTAAIWVGPLLYVLAFDPRDVEVILKSKDTGKADQYKFLKPWLGDSLLTNTGEKFRRSKRIIMPSFQPAGLKGFIPTFYNYTKQLVKELQVELDKEGEFDMGNYLNMLTMDILMETSLGVNKDSLGKEKVIEYSNAVEHLGKCAHIRLYNIFLHPDFTFNHTQLKKEQDRCLNIVHPVVQNVITQRKKEMINNNLHDEMESDEYRKNKTFVDKLLMAQEEDSTTFTDKEIKDEVCTMMFGGQDTTTVSAGFALSLLGYYQKYQDKVIEELDDVFGDSNRAPTFEDLQNLHYLEQVIQETWRLYTPIPYIGKKATKDIKLENCTIPAGATIGIIIMVMHRNPDFFPKPDTFNPDNFSPDKIKDRHPYAYIPFSSGSRICVGRKYAMLTLKVVLSTLLRTYRVFATKHPREYKLAALTTLRRKDGFLISLKKRSAAATTARG